MATKTMMRSLTPGYSISEGPADFCFDNDPSFCCSASVDECGGSCFSISASLEAALSARWCVSSGFSTAVSVAMVVGGQVDFVQSIDRQAQRYKLCSMSL